MDIGYYPGCSLHGMAKEYDMSVNLVCSHLGINLREMEDWNCCGATAAHYLDHKLSIGLGARNLAIANNMNIRKITSPCAGCYNRLKTASHELRTNPELAAEIAADIQHPAPVEPEVTNLVQLLVEDKGIDAISQITQKPLKGLKLAAYYGCLLTRPKEVTRFDDPENPVSLDHLMEGIGSKTVTWSHKAECCGGGYAASETDIVLDLGGQVLESARQAGAEAIVVACPMCGINLDTRQDAISARKGIDYNIPIIYFTQLMGLAFGFSPAQLGLKRLLNDPVPLLKSKGLV